MKYIPLLLFVVLLTGCAASTDQLHEDAMGCGKKWVVEPNGIIRTPTEQEKEDQCKPFWDAYNKRLVAITKREERRALNQGGLVPQDQLYGAGCIQNMINDAAASEGMGFFDEIRTEARTLYSVDVYEARAVSPCAWVSDTWWRVVAIGCCCGRICQDR